MVNRLGRLAVEISVEAAKHHVLFCSLVASYVTERLFNLVYNLCFILYIHHYKVVCDAKFIMVLYKRSCLIRHFQLRIACRRSKRKKAKLCRTEDGLMKIFCH